MSERSKSTDFDAQRPLIASDTTSDESNTSSDLPLMADPASDSSSSDVDASDDSESRLLHAVDSADQFMEHMEQEEATLPDDTRPPRARRKKNSKTTDISPGLPSNETEGAENDINDDIEANTRSRRRKKKAVDAVEGSEIELSSITASQRKSVRWTDDLDGGQLHQEHLALSYNRKDLSYAPKSKIRVGIFSPLQKKLMIGVGSGCLILLIVLFIVLFVVVKPGASSPSAPPTGGLLPVFREPPPPPDGVPLGTSSPEGSTPDMGAPTVPLANLPISAPL
jgi:hypothetical protein